MELKFDSFLNFFIQFFSVTATRSVISQFSQVICLQLDTIQFLISSQTFDLGLRGGFIHDDVSVLILCELVKQILFRKLLPVLFFRTKRFGNCEGRHDRRMINRVELHLITNVYRIR